MISQPITLDNQQATTNNLVPITTSESHTATVGNSHSMAQPASGLLVVARDSNTNSVSHTPGFGNMASMAQPASGHSTLQNNGRGRGGRGRGISTQPTIRRGARAGASGTCAARQAVPSTSSSALNDAHQPMSVNPTPAPTNPAAALSTGGDVTAESNLLLSMQATVPTASDIPHADKTMEMQVATHDGSHNNANVHASTASRATHGPSLGLAAPVPASIFHNMQSTSRALNFTSTRNNAPVNSASNQSSAIGMLEILQRSVRSSTSASSDGNGTNVRPPQTPNVQKSSSHVTEAQPEPMYSDANDLEIAEGTSGIRNATRGKRVAKDSTSKKRKNSAAESDEEDVDFDEEEEEEDDASEDNDNNNSDNTQDTQPRSRQRSNVATTATTQSTPKPQSSRPQQKRVQPLVGAPKPKTRTKQLEKGRQQRK